MNELIKRLRVQAKLTRHYCPHEKMKTLEENAADAIEKLQAENKQLRKDLNEYSCCELCKHLSTDNCGEGTCHICNVDCVCKTCDSHSNWEWRGVQDNE